MGFNIRRKNSTVQNGGVFPKNGGVFPKNGGVFVNTLILLDFIVSYLKNYLNLYKIHIYILLYNFVWFYIVFSSGFNFLRGHFFSKKNKTPPFSAKTPPFKKKTPPFL
jgi:hypothetical protein